MTLSIHRMCNNVTSDLTLRKYPKLELIAADQLPGGDGDTRIFCCFSYPISEDDEQVKVCNKFSKTAFGNECKDRLSSETDQDIRQFIQRLKDERLADPNADADVLKPSVPFRNGKIV
ncbi:unnamed protein product [Orchesella dallaii]|uniref:Uncharacterized protein n=1 Tax=Orchesella dallaii TaxID=48710 RepID=A0ABP1RP93_9HEXA